MKRILVILACLGISLRMTAQEPTIEARIDSMQMLIGEQVHLTLSVAIKEGQQVVFPFFQRTQMLTPGVEVLEMTEVDTTSIDNNMQRLSCTYTLTSFEDTIYYLPPMKVLVDGKEYNSKNLALKVLTLEVDTLHPEQFFPPKDVQDNPFQWSDWSGMYWMAWLLLIFMALAYYVYTRIRDNKSIVPPIKFVRKALPHQKAMKEIEKIKQQRMTASENQKEYYTKLTDTLRVYLQDRFGFNAMEMTSEEIINRLNQEEDKTKIDELTELFRTADLVKFAKHEVLINENDRNLANAIAFIDSTKREDVPTVEQIKPQLTKEQRLNRRTRTVAKVLLGMFVLISLIILAYIIWQLYSLVGY